ncbi:LGFP repeat-containing protein, partial [Rhodococcus aetherivorans]
PTPTPAAEALPAQAPDTPRPDTSRTDAAPAPAPAPAPAQAPPAETVPPLPAELRPAPPAADQPVPPDDPALSSKTAEPDPDWHPTENPKSTLVPGQMRSDREEVPAPFTKEDADKAEIAEARLRSSRSLTASRCQVYWPSWFEVCGAIRDKYNALGGPASFLSYPTSGNIINPGGTGERVTFLNGPIYWSAATGAHPVVNSFLNRWGIHGYEAGWLGYPTTDEIVHADAVGRHQEFQNGAIYVAFQNAVGSAIRNGPLRDKWNSVGAETPGSLLGYPIQDQIPLPDGQGQMDRFERGVIYWHPTHGAHPVTGRILSLWSLAGYEQGEYGYPTSDNDIVVGEPGSTIQLYQRGSIYLGSNHALRAISELQDPSQGFKSYDTGIHPNYCEFPDPANSPTCPVDNSQFGTVSDPTGAAAQENLQVASATSAYFTEVGAPTAKAMFDHYYGATGTDYALGTSVLDSWFVDDHHNYPNDATGSPSVIADSQKALGVAGAITEADNRGQAVKVIYDSPWMPAAGYQQDHVQSLGHYSVSPTIAVIAHPGGPGNHQIQWRQEVHMYDVYDFAKPTGEYGNMAQAAVENARQGYLLGLARNFLVYGSGSVQTWSGVA